MKKLTVRNVEAFEDGTGYRHLKDDDLDYEVTIRYTNHGVPLITFPSRHPGFTADEVEDIAHALIQAAKHARKIEAGL